LKIVIENRVAKLGVLNVRTSESLWFLANVNKNHINHGLKLMLW